MDKYQDYNHYTVYSVNLMSKCIIVGALFNGTIIFSDENKTWKIPLMQVKPYLWLDGESKYLKGVVLGYGL